MPAPAIVRSRTGAGQRWGQRLSFRRSSDGVIGAPVPAPRIVLVWDTAAEGTLLMLGTFRSISANQRQRLADIGFLPVRDRSCLRILYRYDVATTAQLTALVYRRRQKAQLHLQRLYRYHLLERTPLPPLERGGAPLVFRLSRHARNRLGYAPLTRAEAGTQLRHSLNAVEAVVALARPYPASGDPHPVQAWLSPYMSAGILNRIQPDALLAVQLATGSGVLALEIDEATEHADVIVGKLVNYGWTLAKRPGWHLLFVVPHTTRLHWLRRRLASATGRAPRLDGKAWAVTLEAIQVDGLSAIVTPIERGSTGRPLTTILDDARSRRLATPIGSDAWLRLLAFGGVEEFDPVLA